QVHLAERLLDQAVDDRALVGEVEVDRSPADERALGDRVHRQRVVADLRERRPGGLEDRLLRRIAGLHRLACCCRRWGHWPVSSAKAMRSRVSRGATISSTNPREAAMRTGRCSAAYAASSSSGSAPAAMSRRWMSSTAWRGPMTPILAFGHASVRSAPRSREFMTIWAPP